MNVLKAGKWTFDEEQSIFIDMNNTVSTAFDAEKQDGLWDIEDDSWWFPYRADVIIDKMNCFFDKSKLTVDVGGGNGYTSSKAKEKGYYTAVIEPAFSACRHAKQRGIDMVCCGTVTNDSINDNSVDQILLLDVLEHIEDDKSFLELLYRKLAENGELLITVPAFMCLWSSEDVSAGHFRRYRINNLCKLLSDVGFEIQYKNYFMSFLFLPILLIRVWFEKLGLLKPAQSRSKEESQEIARSQFKKRNGIVSFGLNLFEKIEKKLMKKNNSVFCGSSIIVVAKK